jgi:predicted nucleotidyltransferase
MATKNIEQIKAIVKRYYDILLKKGFPVEKVIIFGSYIRNEQTEESEIDVAVILREFNQDRFNTRLELMKHTRDFEEVIEPHPFLLAELEESTPFLSDIINNGEILTK